MNTITNQHLPPMKKKINSFVFLLSFWVLLAPQTISSQGTRLLRTPAISNNKIAFCYASDIWTANPDGSESKRLTVFEGVESDPHFSPDGKLVAFSAQYEGNTDVYVVPAEGGEPKRLTWHPGPDIGIGWTPDGKNVMFVSGRTRAPRAYNDQIWLASLSGSTPTRFILPSAVNGKYSPDGNLFVFEKNMRWESEFRLYRGGQNTSLKIFDLTNHTTNELPWENSWDNSPVWLGDEIFFLSDRDSIMNVWKYNYKTKDLKQLTFFKDFDCKNLEGTGGKLIFEKGGFLFTMNAGDKQVSQLNISIAADFPWVRSHWTGIDKYIENVSISPNGKRILLSARGEIISLPADKGNFRNLTNSSGVADRSAVWSPDGKSICWFSDESGEYQMVISDQFGNNKKKITIANPTFFYHPVWSPDSKYISFYDANRVLWYYDTSTQKITKIDEEGFAHPVHVIYAEWSPDSKWIAYTRRLTNEYSAIFIYSLSQNKAFQITDGMADCRMPSWDKSGKYLYFLSSTDYGMNVGWLDMSSYDHPVNSAIYLVVLSKDEVSPIAPESDDEEVLKEEKKDDKAKDSKKDQKEKVEDKDKTEPVKIDFENIEKRMVALPIPVGKFQSIGAAAEGVIFYTLYDNVKNSLILNKYVIKERESKKLVDNITDFYISSARNKYLYITKDGKYVLSDTDGEPGPKDKTINVGGVKILVEPPLEWKQIFKEAWRYQRDYFYVRNVHGLDLDAVYKTYSQWIPDVKHRSDLNYVLDILGGETSIGHSFNGGGDYPDVDHTPVGLLGADIAIENNKFRIKKIYTGESWNPDLRAPLFAPGINIKEGDYIISINGKEPDVNSNFFSYFDQLADKQIFITVNANPVKEGAREYTVVPVASDEQLRQYEWIEGNRRKVDQLSEGKLAYVWLPNTAGDGYTNFNRYYFAQKDKKGAVIDERYNHGGSIADYIVDLLGRDLLGYFNNPIGKKQPFTAPNAGIWGPKVMIINEMSGSGGDMMPYMFKLRKIGPLVGTRTWGGLVGIWDVPNLIDGGYITAPRGGFYNLEGKWDVENVGIAPDYKVEQEEKSVIEGKDPQLEKAVQTALDLLKTKGVKLLPQPEDPVKVVHPKK